jgi:hypothetical protein
MLLALLVSLIKKFINITIKKINIINFVSIPTYYKTSKITLS